jgi:hypothetical protein
MSCNFGFGGLMIFMLAFVRGIEISKFEFAARLHDKSFPKIHNAYFRSLERDKRLTAAVKTSILVLD